MKIRIPSYYKKFHCIGSACTDNCCIGWEIDIDDKTDQYYQNVVGPFGDRLRSSIADGEEPHFILKHERCPFLNKDNLCDIIITLGEDKLCNICTEHPRFYEWFDGLTEQGVGLCCEEASRLLFESEEPIAFETYETQENDDCGTYDVALFDALIQARETAFLLVQNRDISIQKRIGLVLSFAQELQDCIDDGEIPAIYEVSKQYKDNGLIKKLLIEFHQFEHHDTEKTNLVCNLINIYQALEPIDEKWPEQLSDITKKLPTIFENSELFSEYCNSCSYEYEHIAVYFIYRYFMKAVFDEDLLSKVILLATSYLVIHTLDINQWLENNNEFHLVDRIHTVKSYSKEIEYSQENLDTLADESYENELFSFENLMTMLLS